MSDESLKGPSMERHLQSIIVIIIVGLLGWVGVTVQQTQVAVSAIGVEIEYLKIEVMKPEVRFREIEIRLDRIDRTLGQLEEKHSESR